MRGVRPVEAVGGRWVDRCKDGCGGERCGTVEYWPKEDPSVRLVFCRPCADVYEAARERGLGWKEARRQAQGA